MKSYFLTRLFPFLSLILIGSQSYAQASFIREYVVPGWNLGAYLIDMIEHPDSGYLVIWESFDTSGSDTNRHAISHLNDNGDILQSQLINFGGNSNRISTPKLINSPYGTYLGCYLTSPVVNDASPLMSRINPNTLQVMWAYTYPWPNQNTTLQQAIPLSNGDLLLTGGSSTIISIDSFNAYPSLTRLDSSGNVIYHKQEAAFFSVSQTVTEAPNGNFYVAGTGITDSTYIPFSFLMGTNLGGNPQWIKIIGDSTRWYDFKSIDFVAPDKIIAWGQTLDTTNDHIGPLTYIQFDTLGNLISSREYQDLLGPQGAPHKDSSGFTLGCYTYDWGSDTANGCLIRTDLQGNFEWGQFYSQDIADDSLTRHFVMRTHSLGQEGFLMSAIGYQGSPLINWRCQLFKTDTLGNSGCLSHSFTTTDTSYVLPSYNVSWGGTAFNVQATPVNSIFTPISIFESTQCYSDCVWPGDADDDGIANNQDLLSIGLTYGFSATPRPLGTNNWDCQVSADWSGNFLNGANHKHADCNGDGIVNDADTTAVQLNYGLTHNKTSTTSGASAQDPPLILVIPQDSAFVGDTIHAPILLGSQQIPVDSIYGLAFTLLYDQGLIDTNSAWISFDSSWFGGPSNTLSLYHDFWALGSIDGAITRINHSNINGYSQIATLHIILIDNIEGKRNAAEVLHVEFGDIRAIVLAGEELQMATVGDSLIVVDPELFQAANVYNNEQIYIYPNPSNGQVHLTCRSNPIQDFELYSLNGQLLVQESPRLKELDLDLSGLASGLYLIKVQTRNGWVYRKIILE